MTSSPKRQHCRQVTFLLQGGQRIHELSPFRRGAVGRGVSLQCREAKAGQRPRAARSRETAEDQREGSSRRQCGSSKGRSLLKGQFVTTAMRLELTAVRSERIHDPCPTARRRYAKTGPLIQHPHRESADRRLQRTLQPYLPLCVALDSAAGLGGVAIGDELVLDGHVLCVFSSMSRAAGRARGPCFCGATRVLLAV